MARSSSDKTSSITPPLGSGVTLERKFPRFADFVEAYGGRLSLGGIFVPTAEPPPPGTTIDIDFRLEDGYRLFQAVGEIVWVRTRPDGAAQSAGAGVRFHALNERGRELILKVLEQHVAVGGTPFELENLPAGATRSVDAVVMPSMSRSEESDEDIDVLRTPALRDELVIDDLPADGMAEARRASLAAADWDLSVIDALSQPSEPIAEQSPEAEPEPEPAPGPEPKPEPKPEPEPELKLESEPELEPEPFDLELPAFDLDEGFALADVEEPSQPSDAIDIAELDALASSVVDGIGTAAPIDDAAPQVPEDAPFSIFDLEDSGDEEILAPMLPDLDATPLPKPVGPRPAVPEPEIPEPEIPELEIPELEIPELEIPEPVEPEPVEPEPVEPEPALPRIDWQPPETLAAPPRRHETPPFETPPFETSPLETSPLETSPLETPPLETPPREPPPGARQTPDRFPESRPRAPLPPSPDAARPTLAARSLQAAADEPDPVAVAPPHPLADLLDEEIVPARRTWLRPVVALVASAIIALGGLWLFRYFSELPSPPPAGPRQMPAAAAADVAAPPAQRSTPPDASEPAATGSGAAAPAGAGAGGTEGVSTATDEPTPAAQRLAPARSLRAIEWREGGEATVVTIVVEGGISLDRVRVAQFGIDAPKVVIRLAGIRQPYEPAGSRVEGRHIAAVRTGLHPESDELHVVLDLSSARAGILGAPELLAGDRVQLRIGSPQG